MKPTAATPTWRATWRSLCAAAGTAAFAGLSAVGPAHSQPAAGGPAGNVAIEIDPSLPTHTIFHPALASTARLPLLVWENGSCANDPTLYTPFLSQVAAQGYFVIAKGIAGGNLPPRGPNGEAVAAPPAPARPAFVMPPPGTIPTGPIFDAKSSPPTSKVPDELMMKAVAWAEAENLRAGSRYFHHIDSRRVGLMGYSCGGFTALQVAPLETNVVSLFVINSATNPTWTMEEARSLLATFRRGVPVAWVNGGPSDIAYPGGQRDWIIAPDTMPAWHAEYDDKPPAGADIMAGGHTIFWRSTETARYQTTLATLASNWFEYTLRSGDDKARKYLFGSPCGVCGDPLWSVKHKHWAKFSKPRGR